MNFKNKQKMKRMEKLKVLLLPLLVMALFNSCRKENRCDCIKRTGEIITDIRHISGFDEVFVENNLDVYIRQDSVSEVKVEAGEHIAPLIETEVENGVLYIRNKNRCNWTRSYKKPLNVYVSMPEVRYITSDGTGNIKGTNVFTTPVIDVQIKNSGNIEISVNNTRLLTHIHGAGNMTLHGATNEHDCSIGGTAFMYAADMQTSYTYYDAFTLGESYINATSLLICKVRDQGDVYCYGKPSTVQKDRNGSGDLYLK